MLQLVVGSDDYEIRIFKGDSLITEITETETITSLIPLQDNIFAYSLANGTIGIYERYNRIWRVKVNHVTNTTDNKKPYYT